LNATTSIWKLNSVNEFSQPTQLTTGSFSRTYSYNAYGLPTARKAGSFQNFAYSFDSQKGNLTYRKDLKYNIQENFTYDNLNRLTGYSGLSASYDIKGNITKKSDVGSFEYTNSGKPYAVSKAILSQSAIPLRYQYISYTSFKRPALISEGIYTALFTYCGNEERVKMELRKDGAKELIRYYLSGCYEIDDTAVGSVKEKLYLGGDYYTAAAVYVKQGSGSWALYYICRDYLGSITHITNSSGSLYYQYSYDAWGRLRNPSTQAVYPPGEEPALFLGRGYTGHEHLSQFGLINMNARMYDPALGRFLAPDPFVQAPGFSQSFNRYSYCLNNPLRYTDEDGEFWHIIIGAIAGGFANWASNGFKLNSDGLKSFAIGAVGGALSAALPGSMSIFGASLTASTNSFSGSNQSGISVNVSMGLPFNLPINYSIQGGISYYFKNTDLMGNDMSGWETRYGSQWSVDDVFSYGGTTFNSQWSGKVTTNLTTVGNSSFNVKYENDMEPAGIFKYIPFVPKGDGDRYRTAAAQINMGPFGIGTNMMTGDPGPMGNKQHESINGHDTYVAHDGYNPNSHRMGIFYFRLGPLRFGKNSENTRKIFQNQFAHDFLTGGQSKWFEVLDLKPQWYWGFGYSAGGTLY
jgi:RHS repeat-associated protein